MFTSVRIRNFRQFRDLKLDNLARINLITGQNNTGKTSLLEALWLFAAGPADPGVVSAIARIRGIDEIGLEGASAWGWIFGDHASRDGIVLEGWFDKEGKVAERLQIRQADVARVTGNGHIAPEPETISTAEISGRSLELA